MTKHIIFSIVKYGVRLLTEMDNWLVPNIHVTLSRHVNGFHKQFKLKQGTTHERNESLHDW